MSSTKAILAAAAICFASSVKAHMIMAQPVPFGKSTLNNSPLVEDGSDFPCKQRTGVYDAEGANNVMAQGSNQTLSFIGSATHGGGSCQVSLTTDLNPTADSTFKVIHSIEGGCPIRNTPGNIGNSATTPDPDTYSFTIPSDLATGQYTLAWTWFNKVGNREMYMNCAPITVTGAGSSSSSSNTTAKRRDEEYGSIDDSIFGRSVGSLSSLSSAPEMFVANIPTTVCETVDSMDLKFPNPGDSLEFDNSPVGTTVVLPTGTACPGMSGGSASAVGSAAPAATSAPAAGDASSAVTPASTGGVSPAAGSSANGASGAAASAPAVAPTSAAAAPSGATSSPAGAVPSEAASSPAASAPSEVASSPAAAASSAAPPSSASSGTASTAGGLTGACTTEGEFNCNGGSSFQQCASGSWSVVQPMADGTICTSGQSATLNMSAAAVKQRRAIRFSKGHVRRGISARW